MTLTKVKLLADAFNNNGEICRALVFVKIFLLDVFRV